jgi:hypothetical protein
MLCLLGILPAAEAVRFEMMQRRQGTDERGPLTRPSATLSQQERVNSMLSPTGREIERGVRREVSDESTPAALKYDS